MGYKLKGGTSQTFQCDSLLAINTPCRGANFNIIIDTEFATLPQPH